MNTYLIKKAMIETAVNQGIHQMEEDPKRSIRRLTDLGKQFSSNRFQDMLFSVMQELLDNENSAYYDMMHNLLKNSDHDTLKTFGINFGYMGWTYGAAQIRENESRLSCCIPWTLHLRYDPSRTDGLDVSRMEKLFQEGQDLGIYCYFIRECTGSSDSYALLDLLERYKECAFVWFKGNGRLTAAQVQMLRLCKGTLVSLPVEDAETLLTVSLLREQKIPFALHRNYSDGDNQAVISRERRSGVIDKILTSETALFFLIAEDGTVYSAGQDAYNSRMEQKYPCVIMDYYADSYKLSRILCEHPYLLEIGADGRVIRPDGQEKVDFPFDVPLTEAFRSIMPVFPSGSAGGNAAEDNE